MTNNSNKQKSMHCARIRQCEANSRHTGEGRYPAVAEVRWVPAGRGLDTGLRRCDDDPVIARPTPPRHREAEGRGDPCPRLSAGKGGLPRCARNDGTLVIAMTATTSTRPAGRKCVLATAAHIKALSILIQDHCSNDTDLVKLVAQQCHHVGQCNGIELVLLRNAFH